VASRASRTTIATCDDRLAGFVQWTDDVLNSLFVGEIFRGHGIGDTLCAEAEQRMLHNGSNHFIFYCVIGNESARRFYERRGWSLQTLLDMEIETHSGNRVAPHWVMEKAMPP
jgi:GNAT superfamily N-acetyltransferase